MKRIVLPRFLNYLLRMFNMLCNKTYRDKNKNNL